jgi:ferrous iron transport protein A
MSQYPMSDLVAGCVLPLRAVRAGETVRVTRLAGQPALCYRLREMGFCEMAEVRIMQNNGALVCQVCGSRVGLSRELADSIFVQPPAA